MEIIYAFGNNCLFSKAKKYDKIRSNMQSRKSSTQDPTKFLSGDNSKKYQAMSQILNELFSLRAKIDEKMDARDIMP